MICLGKGNSSLKAYEIYLEELTKLLEKTDNCWNRVSIEHAAPDNSQLVNMKHMEGYLTDGEIVEYLGHLAKQYQ